jgi:diaminohydroxyphosphoribosylaminopyrimidine deaminase/5-amino-6-(5-phosphoribosylamino)uracil reductase
MWITNDIARTLVHKWRTEETAIMIGTNTAEKDNPRLNAREWNGNSPIRLVLDRMLRLPNDLHIFDQSQPTLVFTENELPSKKNLEFVKINFEGHVIQQILDNLYKREVLSLIVEGGEKLINSFLKQFLWDEARVFIGNKFFIDGIKAPVIGQYPVQQIELEESKLFLYKY